MTVYFIGAGPGAPDLITVRGQRLIERCPVCLYAGSLVPAEIVASAPAGARVLDTAPMHLDEIIAEIEAAHARGAGRRPRPLRRSLDLRRHRRADAAARCAGHPVRDRPRRPRLRRRRRRGSATELTLPEIARPSSSPAPRARPRRCPSARRWRCSARAGATLAIHLSIRNLAYVETALTPHYGADCPVVIVYRATWPDEEIIVTTLAEMRARVREEKITRTALIFVGRVFGETKFRDSKLYDETFAHVLRNEGKKRDRQEASR